MQNVSFIVQVFLFPCRAGYKKKDLRRIPRQAKCWVFSWSVPYMHMKIRKYQNVQTELDVFQSFF